VLCGSPDRRTSKPAKEYRGVGEGSAVPLSSSERRRAKAPSSVRTATTSSVLVNQALQHTAAYYLAAHTPKREMTMSKKTLKLTLVAVFVAVPSVQ
jgi:hypothetical protein